MKVKKTERGWAGHYYNAFDCTFRRNTLLEYGETRIVVSTVGAKLYKDAYEVIGGKRWYETMVFHAKLISKIYWDADVSKQITVTSPWEIITLNFESDMYANNTHEAVIEEISKKLLKGEIK